MSVVKDVLNKGVSYLIDYYYKQVESLFSDIKDIAKNRKHTYVEAQAILAAESHLDFIFDRLSYMQLNDNLPPDLSEKVYSLIRLINTIRDFIESTFPDIYEVTYDSSSEELVQR